MGIDSTELLAEIAAVWRQLTTATDRVVREHVAGVVADRAPHLASVFYTELMAVPAALQFLSHEKVQERLHREMQRWLTALFRVSDDQAFEAYVAQQVAVGAVHARIKLPIELLSIAFHVHGRELRDALLTEPLSPSDRARAVHYAMALMSLANGLILSAFVHEVERGARNDEAYRHIAFQHDAKFERERQRAALSEWAQRALMSIPLPAQRANLVPLSRSEFAQWLNHKGRALFDGIEEVDTIREAMRQVDELILPQLAGGTLDEERFPRLVQELDSKLEFIRYVMNDLFDRTTSLEAGRDSVTRLLNRRYLHAILAREVATHADAGTPFSVLLIRLRAEPSLPPLAVPSDERRAHLLQRIASTLLDHCKAGDHLFRYSDHDFLVIEVDTADESVWARAGALREKLMKLLDDEGLRGGRIDIAVANHDGHPDFQQLLRRVEFGMAAVASLRDGLARA